MVVDVSHLFLSPFSLHRDRVVSPVVRLSAEDAHTRLIFLAEQLQEPFVLRTHSVLHVCDGFDQLVLGEPGGVRFEMLLTEGGQTHEAGFNSFRSALP